jgi:hypothetical protein
MREYKPALLDTAPDSQISISLDLGIIPQGFPDAGQYVITLQALPFRHKHHAEAVMESIRDAVSSRLGIRFGKGQNVI